MTKQSVISDVCISAAENEGISYDIYPSYIDSKAYFFLPSCADSDNLCVTFIKDGERLQSETLGEYVILNNTRYSVSVMQSNLPTMYIELDESVAAIDAMNTSVSHDAYCYGDMRIDVPEALAKQKGWKESYTSKENDAESPHTMKMRGRGNTTWSTYFDSKKPYQIRCENKLNILGMGDAKKWLLIKNEAVRADVLRVYQKMGLDLARDLGIELLL